MRREEAPPLDRRRILQTLAAVLAIAGAVGLSALGLHRARAGDAPAAAGAPSVSLAGIPDGHEGPTCRAGEKPVWHPSRADALGQVLAHARQEAAASGEKVVVLNTRGYNYGTGRDVWQELDRVQREALQPH
jgi:hypothetical protein